MANVLILALLVIAGLIAVYVGYTGIQTGLQSQGWPSVQGIITQSSILVSQSCNQQHGSGYTSCTKEYAPDVHYNYTVGGTKYETSGVTFQDSSSSDQGAAQSVIAQYSVGSSVTIFYNPSNPSQAVLKTGIATGSIIILGLGLIFIIVGIIVFLRNR